MTVPAVAIDLPAGWRHRTDVGPLTLFAQADPWPAGFVPNLTVAVTSFDGGQSLERYLARQVEAAAVSLTDALLVDVEIDRPGSTVTFVVAHATTGVDLTLLQHHRVVDREWVLAAAVTAADEDWPAVAADAVRAVRSVRANP